MSQLLQFTEDQRALLIGLPYRVGIWISHAEDEEGELDDEKEMKALHRCIGEIAKLNQNSPFVQELTRETIRNKERRFEWMDDAHSVLKDAAKIAPVLQAQLSEAEYKSFYKAMMEIAKTVAEAYGEFGDWDDEEESGFLSGLIGKVTDGFSALTDSDANHPMNISPAEDSALSHLAKVLKPPK